MADPKYANLPGIAYDQPDIYETNDLPESDQNADFYEEDNDCIERLHLNATEAFTKFRGKSLDAKGVDFSDRLSRNVRLGYDARSGDWELVGEGEKETPTQKFQRLQCEIKELIEEVASLKASTTEQLSEQTPCTIIANQLEHTQKQLVDLRLDETLGADLIRDLADPQGSQLKKLLAQMDSIRSKGVNAAKSTKKVVSKTEAGDIGTVTYQLNYRPDQARLEQSTRVAELEQKIHQLEAALGTSTDKMSRLSVDTHHNGLLDLAQHLSAQVNLLDSAQLDKVEGRLTALVGKMDSVAEKSVHGPEEDERNKKINELYELAKKSEEMSQILPRTLERLMALEPLHQQAADFSKALTHLEALQQQISATLQNNEQLVKGVEANFNENLEAIKKNMSSLDLRISNLKKK